MDALDKEALNSNWQGEDELDREALNWGKEVLPEHDGTTCSILESMGVGVPKNVPGHPSNCNCAYCKKIQKK